MDIGEFKKRRGMIDRPAEEKRRGRPPLNTQPEASPAEVETQGDEQTTEQDQPRRGRPPNR